jgi:hypothetical protein
MEWKIMLNQKGQAALMDSIIFLTIVASIATGLLYFTINYGISTEEQLSSFYSSDFASDTLKVITYINVARDGTDIYDTASLGSTEVQLDYLLALMKEDYADKQELSLTTINSIKTVFESVLLPFDAALDYSYYLYNEDEDDFLFMLFATHECTSGCDDPTAEKNIDRIFYYCKPTIPDYLETDVFPKVGQVDSAFGKVTLHESNNLDTPGKPFIMALHVWITREIPELIDLESNTELSCCVIGETCS